MITARDGIAGRFDGATLDPRELVGNDPDNMARWAPWVRAFVINNEIFSRLNCTSEVVSGSLTRANIWHEEVTLPPGQPPQASYHRLLSLTRPSRQDFIAQLDLVNNYADLRNDRAAEVLNQVGFPTPFFGSIVSLHPESTSHTLELVGICQIVAAALAMQMKHRLACLRPDAYSPQIQPMIPTPGHGTLPSAHAAEAFIVAGILSILLPPSMDRANMLMAQASRIAVNRTVAGVHFPADTFAGALMGLTLAEYIAARARGGSLTAGTFDGNGIAHDDFHVSKVLQNGARTSYTNGAGAQIITVDHANADHAVSIAADNISSPLNWLWQRAQAEWT